jgi:hypothetical protein
LRLDGVQLTLQFPLFTVISRLIDPGLEIPVFGVEFRDVLIEIA